MEQNLKPTNTNESSDEVDLDRLAESISSGEIKFSNVPEEPNGPEKPKFEGYKTNTLFFHFLCVFGVVFVSLLFFLQIYLTPITVVGQSMLPNINASTTSNEDTTHCDVVYYRAKDSYSRGDVVIISNEKNQYIDNTNSTSTNTVNFLIKRIIACPGDTIIFSRDNVIENKYYYVVIVKDQNGNVVNFNDEDYIKEPMYYVYYEHQTLIGLAGEISNAIFDDGVGYYQIKMSENQYFAMGDNRNNSSDSRYFGPVNSEDICGDVRLHVKYGENIWIALFNKFKSYLSVSYIKLKENL